jgi:hypothetical protein
MTVAIGTLATSSEIKARWAYSEIPSLRFGKKYLGQGPDHLRTLALDGAPFSAVNPNDWPQLVAMAEHGRNKDFVDSIDLFGAPSYRCEGWQLDDLLDALTLPAFGRVPYPTFLTRNPGAVLKGGMPAFDEADPRVVAWSVDPTQPFVQTEPIIVVRIQGQLMIIDGYLRSLLWFRKHDAKQPLLAWLPVGEA